MRIIALYLYVVGFSLYAWKNWYVSLCALILMMGVIEHEDMPKTMMGIHGLNMWNILFAMVLLAWLVGRHRVGLMWDLPRHVNVIVILYLTVIWVGVLRAILDQNNLVAYGTRGLIAEDLVNTTKWVLPGLLLFDGCRTRRRVLMALVCIVAVYLLIALQLVLRLPLSSVLQGGGDINRTRLSCQRIGYCATDLSVMLAGVSWAILAMLLLVRKRYWLVLLFAAGTIATGQALTGGRGGYLAWAVTGLVMCLLKWRKYLIAAPLLLIVLPLVFPGVVDRMLLGLDSTDAAGQATVDEEALTAGRSVVWPYVVDKILGSPVVGYGKLAMTRTGLYHRIEAEHPGTGAPHPHNMYLETLLDNGVLGSVPIVAFWLVILLYSGRLFRSSNSLYSAVGGLSLAVTLSSLIGGITGQHVYPQEHTLVIWAAAFLVFRVYVEEKRAQEALGATGGLQTVSSSRGNSQSLCRA